MQFLSVIQRACTKRIMRSHTPRNLDFNVESLQTAVHKEDNFIFY